MPETFDQAIPKILAGEGKIIAEQAQELAKLLERVKRAQIRNFYGPMTKIRESGGRPEEKLNRLHLMRPRLVYMKARESNAGPLQERFEKLIRNAEPRDVEGIIAFAEAVVGYHREFSRD